MVDASSSIAHQHDAFLPPSGPAEETDWYAEAGTTFDPLRYTFTKLCSPPSLVNLLGTMSSTALPALEQGLLELRRYCRQNVSSVSIDAGEFGLIDPVHPRLGFDFEDEPRIFVEMDAGADEYLDAQPFLRGNANSDAVVDVSDAVFLLASLFIPGSTLATCDDACDSNDDGGVDVSDSVFLLAFLFVPGSPPPPAPGQITCGLDPTVDNLNCLDNGCP